MSMSKTYDEVQADVRAAYERAARECLTPEAAERYCAGDMDATDDDGHALIARTVSAYED